MTPPTGLALYSNPRFGPTIAPRHSVVFVGPCVANHFVGHAVFFLLAMLIPCWAMHASACPFCTALAPTLSDDLDASSAAVIGRCESVSAAADGFRVCRMRITEVVKGDPGLVDSVIEVTSTNRLTPDRTFWLVGYGEAPTEWVSPKQISTQAIPYLRGLSRVPEHGPQRLKYFLRFLAHEDEIVSSDAYNEFAESTAEDIAALGDRLDRSWVIRQLRDESVPVHRRRLCWTFLAQCGTAADACLFDELLRKRRVDATFDPGMDAAIACFITLAGERGLRRIERDYLANPDAEYLDSFAAVSAIRVHGTELNVLPRRRLAAALRELLDQPALADLVIPDLARWNDWSAIDRVVKLFEGATEETRFVKPVAVLYLRNCPLPAAAEALDRLRAIDSEAVEMAESSMMRYPGLATIPVPPPDDEEAAASLAEGAPRRDAGPSSEEDTVADKTGEK